MKVEIDIDLGHLADEWEPVAYRKVKAGEHAVLDGDVLFFSDDCVCPQLVVRKRWQWPEWLKAEWIAGDEDGDWYLYDDEPVIGGDNEDGYWVADSPAVHLSVSQFAFTPPPCDDWRQSKRRNPHAKENKCQK